MSYEKQKALEDEEKRQSEAQFQNNMVSADQSAATPESGTVSFIKWIFVYLATSAILPLGMFLTGGLNGNDSSMIASVLSTVGDFWQDAFMFGVFTVSFMLCCCYKFAGFFLMLLCYLGGIIGWITHTIKIVYVICYFLFRVVMLLGIPATAVAHIVLKITSQESIGFATGIFISLVVGILLSVPFHHRITRTVPW